MDYQYLRHLAIFCVVVEAGSFAAAARALHTSRSRVSEQIAELESALDSRLLQRSTRQLTVTEEGNRVYERARVLQEVLQDIDSFTASEHPAGRVAITANHDIAHKFVMPAMVAFKTQYPDVYVDFLVSDERIDLIHDKVDLAVRIGIPKDASLIARVLHEEAFALYAQPEMLAKYGMPENVEGLTYLPWVLLDLPNWNNSVRLHNASGTRVITPTNYHRCNSPMLIHKMAASGLGVASFLPSTVQDEVDSGALTPIFTQWRGERMTFSLVYPSRKHIPQRTRVLIDFLVAYGMFE